MMALREERTARPGGRPPTDSAWKPVAVEIVQADPRRPHPMALWHGVWRLEKAKHPVIRKVVDRQRRLTPVCKKLGCTTGRHVHYVQDGRLASVSMRRMENFISRTLPRRSS
jgi:hypothetical protein